jgi:hypothetical protein
MPGWAGQAAGDAGPPGRSGLAECWAGGLSGGPAEMKKTRPSRDGAQRSPAGGGSRPSWDGSVLTQSGKEELGPAGA